MYGISEFGRSHVTMILHGHWWKLWSRDTDISIISIKNEKLNDKIIIEATLSYLGYSGLF